jgi:EAL domain-containing protein (putative c-di-GMP-specific phosphodiesterase class I)/GGDEF domain-containing protein
MHLPEPTPTDPPDQTVVDALEDLLDREAISMVFQPIVDLKTAEITGYEALTRPAQSSGFGGADALFGAAEVAGLHEALESLARRKTRDAANDQGVSSLLFINTSPPTFVDDRFEEIIRSEFPIDGGIPSHRIVLEVTERAAEGGGASMINRALSLREHGFSVALDDTGSGVSGLNQIMSLRPNWIKLDIELISEIDLDPLKQNLIRFFVHFAKLGNMNVVAEGIERREQLRVLIELGVTHGQGYFLARPGRFGADLAPGVREIILDLQRTAETQTHLDAGAVRVASLARPIVECAQSDPIGEVRARIDRSARVPGFIVLDGRRYVGWASREQIVRWSDEGDPDAPISAFPLGDGPLIGQTLSLADALEMVAARPAERQHVPLVVQKAGEVSGVVTLSDLLQAAAVIRRRPSSSVAPLTGLPSRVQADRWIADRIRAGDPCHVVFIDVRDFDAYNVAYGHERGDEMLIRIAGLATSKLVDVDGGATFFAHLGEDRFMLGFDRDPVGRLHELIDAFERLQSEFFSSLDLAAGCFRRTDAETDDVLPLSSLRVIHLPEAMRAITEPRDLHYIARRLSLRTFDDSAAGRREILTDRRFDDESLRAAG